VILRNTLCSNKLLQTLNLRTVLQNVRKEEVFENTIQTPLLVVFLTFKNNKKGIGFT